MRVFFGAWDPKAPAIGLMERVMGAIPAARDALPSGDFRDWPAIEAWADEITAELARTYAPAELPPQSPGPEHAATAAMATTTAAVNVVVLPHAK
jgi:hypothetical protein